ncbi:hypothetical protein J4558_00065 [Leptolyngbya sp. 15MV]|nr:hypothetical protein J4558_00065 [Leptolyngbya sp. 15MV]
MDIIPPEGETLPEGEPGSAGAPAPAPAAAPGPAPRFSEADMADGPMPGIQRVSMAAEIARRAARLRAVRNIPERGTTISPREPMEGIVTETAEGILIRPATSAELREMDAWLGVQQGYGVLPDDVRDVLRMRTMTIDRIGPETFQRLMAAAEATAAEDIAARGGARVSVADAIAAAEAVPIHTAVTDVLARANGDILTPVQMLAGVRALQAAFHYWDGLATRMRGQAQGSPEDVRDFMRAAGLVQAITAQMRGNASETARAMRFMQEVDRMWSNTGADDIGGMMRSFALAAGERMRREGIDLPPGGVLTPEQMQAYVDARYMAEQYLFLRRRGREAQLVNALANAPPGRASWGDAFVEAFINSILSSPITHYINVMGSAAFGLMDILDRGAAAAIGSARRAVLGPVEASDRVYWAEVAAKVHGVRTSFLEALTAGRQAFATGETLDDASKLDRRYRGEAISAETFGATGSFGLAIDYVGRALNLPTRMLLAEDDFFKTVFRQSEMHALAVREAQRQIAAGVPREQALNYAAVLLTESNRPLWNEASEYARFLTFQTEGGLMLRAVGGALQNPLLKPFVPFLQTPTNIVLAMAERNILTALPFMAAPNTRLRRMIEAGGATRDVALARIATGSLMIGAAATMAWEMNPVDGLRSNAPIVITGSRPGGADGQAFDRVFQPYSIAVRQDDGSYRSVSYARYDPLSGLLAIGADIAMSMVRARERGQSATEGEVMLDMLYAGTIATANYLGELPMLSGFSDLVRAIGQPQADEGDLVARIARVVGQTYASAGLAAVTPFSSAVALAERISDPRASETRLPSGEAARMPEAMLGIVQAIQQWQSRIPGVSDTIPLKLNLWGETVDQAPSMFAAAVPAQQRIGSAAPIDRYLVETGLSLDMPDTRIDGVRLSAEQYEFLLREANRDGRLKGALNDIVASPGFAGLDRQAQIELLRRTMAEFRTVARDALIARDADLRQRLAEAAAFKRRTGQSYRE